MLLNYTTKHRKYKYFDVLKIRYSFSFFVHTCIKIGGAFSMSENSNNKKNGKKGNNKNNDKTPNNNSNQ